MSGHPTPMHEGDRPTSHGVYGQELLRQLQHGFRALPKKTLFSLVTAGLRVRLMRSVVTMVSVVLAIAFLAYTGLSNRLYYNAALQVSELENFVPVEPERVAEAARQVSAIDVVAAMAPDKTRALALSMKLTDTDAALERHAAAGEELRKTALDAAAAAQTEYQAAQADASLLPGDVELTRVKATKAQAHVDELRKEIDTLAARIHVGRWLAGDESETPGTAAALKDVLRTRWAELTAAAANPGRLTEADVRDLTLLLPVANRQTAEEIRPAPALLQQTLEHERRKRDARELRTRLRRAGVNIEETLAGSTMDTWLISMALITCAVGIANAMLMSVTERFREIGTMKCLGAQDSLVIQVFLLESALLGVVGAVLGIVTGLLVSLLAAVLQFGTFGVRFFPFGHAGFVVLWSLVAGIVLAVVGAVYPALVAARMRPVDALRVDE